MVSEPCASIPVETIVTPDRGRITNSAIRAAPKLRPSCTCRFRAVFLTVGTVRVRASADPSNCASVLKEWTRLACSMLRPAFSPLRMAVTIRVSKPTTSNCAWPSPTPTPMTSGPPSSCLTLRGMPEPSLTAPRLSLQSPACCSCRPSPRARQPRSEACSPLFHRLAVLLVGLRAMPCQTSVRRSLPCHRGIPTIAYWHFEDVAADPIVAPDG